MGIIKRTSSPKKKFIQVCPKCGKPYSPDKTSQNAFGIFAFGFKCKHCKYQGPGPIKIAREDYEDFLKELKSGS